MRSLADVLLDSIAVPFGVEVPGRGFYAAGYPPGRPVSVLDDPDPLVLPDAEVTAERLRVLYRSLGCSDIADSVCVVPL